MKITIREAESIIERINTIHNEIIFPELLTISEFDDPETRLEKHYHNWLDYFTRKEALINIAYELQNQLDVAFQRSKLNVELNKLNKNDDATVMMQRLAKYPVKLDKNQILGYFNKKNTVAELAQIQSSIFDEDKINHFKSFEQELQTERQNLINKIESIKNKSVITLSDDMINTLENENLFKRGAL